MTKRGKQKVLSVAELLEREQGIQGIAAQVKGTGPMKITVPDSVITQTIEVNAMGEEVHEPAPKAITQRLDQTLSSPRERLGLQQILEAEGIDPVKELLDAYNERVDDPGSPDHGKFVMSPGERRSLMRELLKYTHPQLKSVDHSGTIDNKLTVVLRMPDGTTHAKDVEQRGKPIDV